MPKSIKYKYTHKFRFSGEFHEWLHHDEDEGDQKVLEVHCYLNKKIIAKAFFGYLSESRGRHLACLEIFVKEEHRRKKIATEIYNLAEKVYFDTCKPYPGHSADAKAFWLNRK